MNNKILVCSDAQEGRRDPKEMHLKALKQDGKNGLTHQACINPLIEPNGLSSSEDKEQVGRQNQNTFNFRTLGFDFFVI